MIPNRIHFIFGLQEDFGGKPFSFLHYLSVRSAYDCNRPEVIRFHYAYEPTGEWWERARQYVTPIRVEPPEQIHGKKLVHYAHQADVLRLELILREGGIYLDTDVICLRSFAPLLKYDCVMGKEGRLGLCNAVIMASPGAEFLRKWHEAYRCFRSTGRDDFWNEHSVLIPGRLATLNRSLIHIEGRHSFFWPLYSDPAILWGSDGTAGRGVISLPGMQWAARRILRRAFCVHMWSTLWWERYLKNLSPEYFERGDNNFSWLCKRFAPLEDKPCGP